MFKKASDIICFFTFFFFISNFIVAQTLPSPFITKTYTAQDGLPHSYIYSVLQDSKGYLWVGTRYGLGRYDGHTFFTIDLNDLSANSVISLVHEDAKGKIWLYLGSGVYVLEGKKISLYKNNLNISLTSVFKGENSNRINELWFIQEREMYRMDNCSGTENISVPDFGNKYCRRAALTSDGNFYNLMEDIIYVDKNGNTDSLGRLLPPYNYIVIMGYFNKQLYFYTNNGIYAYADKKIKSLFPVQLSGKHVYTAYRDTKNRFWVATEQDGILISKAGDQNKFSYSISPSHHLISGFYEDNENHIWIAGFEGLMKVQEKYFEDYNSRKYPYLTDLNLIAKDKEGTVYFFSETNGFSNWQHGKFSYLTGNSLKGQLIDAICHDNKNRSWCITRQNKLILFSNGQTKIINDAVLNTAGDLQPDIVYDDYRKKIWVPGETLLTGDENGFTLYKDSQNVSIKNPYRILNLSNGKLLISTSKNELLLITSAGNIRKLNVPENFYPEKIYRFFSDSSDNIWISYTGTGLLKCRLLNDSRLKILNKYNTDNGLANNFIHSLAFDKQGRLWLSTMAGIAVLEFEDNVTQDASIFLFGKNEGIPAGGLEYGRLLCYDDGEMWYCTQNALMKFQTNKMQFNNLPPRISIENVLLNNQQTDWEKYTDSLSGIFQLPVNPVMKYHENTITIDFKAATMTNAENVQYSYLLSGINNYWSNSSKNNTITFTNLKPGNYTFFVRASTNSLNWCTPALFSFTITSPYWQKGWFKWLVLGIIAGTLYFLYRFRIKQLKKEKAIRDQIASDLHDDLGSTLNSVKIYANVASIEKDNNQYLDKIKESIQEAISSVRDIVWVLDEKKDTLEHLFTRINQFASPVCDANHIQFIQHIDNLLYNHQLHREEKRNLFMIIKEVINNSIKYADCKNISVTAEVEKKKLKITITDNGKGFDVQRVLKGNGMDNIRKRANEIHYHIEINSKAGTGTTVLLEKT
jgi:ligand-binding sensor domain-containing protein/two-component sensor histidine kinase